MNYLDSIINKNILIAGGTGSFGKEFVKHILPSAKKIIVYSRDELKQCEMQAAFGNNKKIRFFIGDVRDEDRLKMAMENVDIVIHAAALKHVPICEYNPFEAIKTNIIGTQNVIMSSIYNNVDKVILLSTDKSVNPINLYGATKMCAEKIFVQSNIYAPKHNNVKLTKFSCVRYGNVVGSRGSIIPVLFAQRLLGEVTITDEDMTRFWITLEQSVELVLYSLTKMIGGEIFIPKLKSSKIMDLVEVIAPKCKIKIIGKRPGEKIHESLITEEEFERTVDDTYCYKILPKQPQWNSDEWNVSFSKKFIYNSKLVERVTREELEGFVAQFERNNK